MKVTTGRTMEAEVTPYRWGGPHDEAVSALVNDVFVAEGYTTATMAAGALGLSALRERGAPWVVLMDGRVVGVAFLVEPRCRFCQIAVSGELEVQLLAVDPRHRGGGVGGALVRRLITEAKARGVRKLVLSTQPTMHAAHALYEKLGFVRQPQRDWARPDGRTYLAYVADLTR